MYIAVDLYSLPGASELRTVNCVMDDTGNVRGSGKSHGDAKATSPIMEA